MTKAEEIKLLAEIDKLIKSAGADSYIGDTFAGIVEICKNNIINDFGDYPVQDLDDMRIRVGVAERDRDEKKMMLSEAQNALNEARRDMEGMQKQIAKLTEERDCMAECVDGNNSIIDQAEAEIRKLKAEIVRMRMERMDDNAMAMMYDRMRGDFDD